MNKKIKVFIIFSVLLNVLLAGMVCGHMLHCFGAPDVMPPLPPEERMAHILDKTSIPQERKQFILSRIKSVMEPDPKAHDEIHATWEKVRAILSADPFDAASYNAITERLITLRNTQGRARSKAMEALAEQLNADERKALSEMIIPPPPPHELHHHP